MNYHKHTVKKQLKRLDVKPSKQRGQNFLLDETVIEQIADFGGPREGRKVVEIGPGLGALTKYLVDADSLALIELEEQFCGELQQRFPLAQIIQGDAREVNYSEFGSNVLLYGNLPYAFSTEIIFHVLTFRSVFESAVFLLQREFAERMAAGPGSRTYGVLSVMVQLVANVELGPVVPGTVFHPQTHVSSRMLKLTFPEGMKVDVQDIQQFRRVVRAAFHQRRKMIHNSLKSSGKVPKELVDVALEELSLDPSRRAETFSLEEFARLSDWFSAQSKV
jgi:16S rRNA (adenine1518-N6/adenine1519-N6)-dimethyltransferase